jgi:hypothetical protein
MSEWRRIGFLSDLHTGSLCAPWPDEYEMAAGNVICASPAQRILRQYLDDFLSHEMREAEMIFLLGDMCQGENRKETGRGTTTPELDAQVGAAAMLIDKIVDSRPIRGVTGSGYHQAMSMSLDKALLQKIGGNDLEKLRHVRIAGPGCVIQVAHGVGGGAIYDGTVTDRESIMLDVAEARQKIPYHVDLIVRGHLHHFFYMEDCSRAFLRLPCWQTWYGWDGLIGTYGKKQPDLGGVCVDCGPKGRIVLHKRLYPAIQIHDGLMGV